MITAIDIPTKLWNRVFDTLVGEGWNPAFEYDHYDAGIDFNLLVVQKDGEEIFLGWDHWLEGEIKCTYHTMKYIEQLMSREFTMGPPNSLKPEVIELVINGQNNKK